MKMNVSVVSLGSNKGNKARNLLKAVDLLSAYPKIQREKVSSIYKTAPLYDEDQPFFYNAAAVFQTSLSLKDFFEINWGKYAQVREYICSFFNSLTGQLEAIEC